MMIAVTSVNTRYRSAPSASGRLLLKFTKMIGRKKLVLKLLVFNFVFVAREFTRARVPSFLGAVDEIKISENETKGFRWWRHVCGDEVSSDCPPKVGFWMETQQQQQEQQQQQQEQEQQEQEQATREGF